MKETWKYFRRSTSGMIGFCAITMFLIVGLFAPIIAPYGPDQIHEGFFRIPPWWNSGGSSQFLLGTDDLGRDLFSRLVYGTRVSLSVGFLVVVFSLMGGTALGLLAGYKGGMVDSLIMRLVDILMSLPSILLAIVVVAILGPGLFHAILAVSVVAMPAFIRLVRASVLEEKSKEYVVASKSFGASHYRQAFKVILPNCMAPLIVQGTLGFSDGILNAAALGFLSLGAQPPTPEWGTMLSDARSFIETSPWLVTLPGLCILTVVLGFNLLGDGLRDALDPRLKRR